MANRGQRVKMRPDNRFRDAAQGTEREERVTQL